ncbi:MAG: L-2-amino-thiazoline-4-carboxylic acid hydrolase [Polyangiales bacterium]
MSIPTPTPATLTELLSFDLRYGLPSVVSVLRSKLTLRELGRVAFSLARHAPHDPLAIRKNLPSWNDAHDKLTRYQLRALFRLDDATRSALRWDEAARLALLREVVAASGSVFISKNVPFPSGAAWKASNQEERADFAARLQGRLFNTIMKTHEVTDRALAFDVSACRFAQLCRAYERMYLAPLFCEADARFFRDSSTGIQLQRTKTLARGDDVCDFRFVWE